MNFRFLLPAVAFIISFHADAQRKIKQMDSEKQEQNDKAKQYDRTPFWEKVSYGGNASGILGSNYSFFMLQPMAFYRITDNTMAGVGVTYYYWSQKITQTISVSDNSYGFNFFVRQIIKDPVFVHAEYMPMNFNSYDRITYERKRIWGHSLYLGGGVQQKFSDRGGYYVMFLYNVLWKDVYSSFSPVPYDIRMGFFF